MPEMSAAEREVREVWAWVIYRDTAYSVLAGPHCVIIEANANRKQIAAFYRHTPEECWASALAFTHERREEIKLLENGIRWLDSFAVVANNEADEMSRLSILARERAVLGELKRGMK